MMDAWPCQASFACHLKILNLSSLNKVVLVRQYPDLSLINSTRLFFAELTGPGKVWLQSLSMASLAESLQPYLSSGDGGGSGIGNIIGS